MCQCPQRASTHFFLLTDIWEENTDITSVNALNGLLLISSKDGKLQWVIGNCVNALNGLLLISSVIGGTTEKNPFCVNALNGLLLISSYFTGWKAE